MNLNILYEDNHIIVVVKEPNILSQEDNSKDSDMLSIIKSYIKEKYNKPGNVFLGLVHRLDRPVGGVMVFARTSKAASRLSDEIRNNQFKKKYLAVVHGKLDNKHDTIKNYLIKDMETNSSKIVPDNTKDAKEAILEYDVINYDEDKDLSLLDINLITGRHHQIRVQLAGINHPILGDQRYGSIDEKKVQIYLWAYLISFKHPVKDDILTFEYKPDWKII
jgi:23S rRNA pseudouridine1911/1915/1917 synthase